MGVPVMLTAAAWTISLELQQQVGQVLLSTIGEAARGVWALATMAQMKSPGLQQATKLGSGWDVWTLAAMAGRQA